VSFSLVSRKISLVGLRVKLSKEKEMTLTIRKKITILALIDSLPVLCGKCDDGHKLIPWSELDDSLRDIEPRDVKNCARQEGMRVEFSGVGMTIFRGE